MESFGYKREIKVDGHMRIHMKSQVMAFPIQDRNWTPELKEKKVNKVVICFIPSN